MQSLRIRLLISHSLPLIIIILLTGFSLDYLVETQILLPSMANELSNEAKLLAELTSLQSDLWEDSENSQAYLSRLEPLLGAYVTLFDFQGKYLASTDPYVLNSINPSTFKHELVQSEGTIIQTTYGVNWEANVVDVFVPVLNEEKIIVGAIQMTYHLENVYDQLFDLRRGIVGILTIGILLGSVIAFLVSANLNRAILQVNTSIQKLAIGQEIGAVEEEGPKEIRELMRTVNLFVSRVQSMETTRRKLLSNLVHELGRPLGALLPAVQALQAGASKDEELRLELLEGMEVEINILRRLLNDLTGLYDQVVGTFTLERQIVNLNELLPTLVRSQQEAAHAKGINWISEIHSNMPVTSIDPGRITQAVGNLIDNAIKFTPPGGEITFSASFQGSEIRICVQDTGSGIPVKDQEYVFTPFFQSRAETRFPHGMGLGLSIAHDLVSAHQGRLEFESLPGEGSSFTIWLPILH